ncbi:hypothetical protein A33O_12749 [Nitratireductor aquibiodomus RA22]|uniref:Uncharacterized protein n=2 Tax=Nitratireductor aquibiodomus TaxID=204799 RepID=A0A1H4JQ63_9HYPH|nr:hypothetical protein [Nitratireductor aquibiodomus]EIM74245.1 hypothetical protein A33O_12749 [Nitratireductor aquibiodomus RA22]SEB48393.1 hypothetical protein SAMN05216452_1582 [Nitratireductor aquibiodomus]
MAFDTTSARQLRAGSIRAQQRAFMEWVVSLPPDADIEYAAQCQLAEIDRRLPGHPQVQYLRLLLTAFAGSETTH